MIYANPEPLAHLLTDEEREAILLMRMSFGVDVTRTYQFWEAMVARIVDGSMTAHRCGWDVEASYGLHVIRIEVKFSREFECRFNGAMRSVFKFANPRGTGVPKSAEVTVFLGLDAQDNVYSWVVPSRRLRVSTSITLTSPRVRQYKYEGRHGMDDYMCPPSQILPSVCNAWRDHLRLDAALHAQHARATRVRRREDAGQMRLPDD